MNAEDKQGFGPERAAAKGEGPSRFHRRYRALTQEELGLHDDIKDGAELMCAMIERLPNCRDRSIALTKLEDCVMRAIRALVS